MQEEQCSEEQDLEIGADVNVGANENNRPLNFQSFYSIYRDKEIFKEFQYITEHPINGIYVFPSIKSLQIWYGVIFIHEGLFAEGIFHFKVILNDDYPYSKPSIRFTSNVFHPRISQHGMLNIDVGHSRWKTCKHWVHEALNFTRHCLCNIDTFNFDGDIESRANEDTNNTDDYKARTRSCVLESLLEFEERETNASQTEFETDNPFNCKLLSPRINSSLKRNILLKGFDNARPEESLIGWTKQTVGKMWNNISHYSVNNSLHTAQTNGYSFI